MILRWESSAKSKVSALLEQFLRQNARSSFAPPHLGKVAQLEASKPRELATVTPGMSFKSLGIGEKKWEPRTA